MYIQDKYASFTNAKNSPLCSNVRFNFVHILEYSNKFYIKNSMKKAKKETKNKCLFSKIIYKFKRIRKNV